MIDCGPVVNLVICIFVSTGKNKGCRWWWGTSPPSLSSARHQESRRPSFITHLHGCIGHCTAFTIGLSGTTGPYLVYSHVYSRYSQDFWGTFRWLNQMLHLFSHSGTPRTQVHLIRQNSLYFLWALTCTIRCKVLQCSKRLNSEKGKMTKKLVDG